MLDSTLHDPASLSHGSSTDMETPGEEGVVAGIMYHDSGVHVESSDANP